MLSEFAISKPLKAFNQVHMDSEESLLDSVDAVLLFPGPRGVPGLLHLASRSVYFQPSDSRLALVRFKFSDDFAFARAALADALQRFESPSLAPSDAEFWSDLWRVLFQKFDRSAKTPPELRASLVGAAGLHIDLCAGAKTVFRVRTSKAVIYERNPPKGYSVFRLPLDFAFLVDGFLLQRESLSGPLKLSSLSAQQPRAQPLSAGASPLLAHFNEVFATAFGERLFFSLREKQRSASEMGLGQFRLFRFASVLKKLAKHLREAPIVEKLKEMRFHVFAASLRRFGMALFEPDVSVSRLGLAKGRGRSQLAVARARDLQRNLEFLNFQLTEQLRQNSIESLCPDPRGAPSELRPRCKTEPSSEELLLAPSEKYRTSGHLGLPHAPQSPSNYFRWLCRELPRLPRKPAHEFLFVFPCVAHQLFESFFCAVFATEFALHVRPLLNVTKDVTAEVPFGDVKHVFPYQMVDGAPALELFTRTSLETLLLSFQLDEQRSTVLDALRARADSLAEPDLQAATKSWMQGMLPSFDYLMLLNRLSNRSFQDIAQYPLFPWVISDYFSEAFVKNEKAQYRHLWDPLGAHSGARRQRADELFQAISQDARKLKSPFHQGVYVSTPGYVMFFYMRAVPSLVVRLQSSAFSPPEKIFKSFESLWSSIHSMVNYPSELIPEFFCARQSEILLNEHGIMLGSSLTRPRRRRGRRGSALGQLSAGVRHQNARRARVRVHGTAPALVDRPRLGRFAPRPGHPQHFHGHLLRELQNRARALRSAARPAAADRHWPRGLLQKGLPPPARAPHAAAGSRPADFAVRARAEGNFPVRASEAKDKVDAQQKTGGRPL